MPDRAVVDDDLCPQRTNVHGSPKHQWGVPQPGSNGRRVCLDCAAVQESQPRALVALSEDRQWLVIHDGGFEWDIWKRKGDTAYEYYDWVSDTGQDAHQVLAAFMSEQEGVNHD